MTPTSLTVTMQNDFSSDLRSFQTVILRISPCCLIISNLVTGTLAQYLPNAGVIAAGSI